MLDLKPKIKSVTLPDGEVVHIRQFTVKTRQHVLVGANDDDLFQARLLCHSLCDADGKLLYSSDDVERFGDVPVTVADHLIKEIVALNGFNIEAKKNSSPTMPS